MWFNKKYIQTLESSLRELKDRCAALEIENRQLYDRLLTRSNVVPVHAPAPSLNLGDPATVERLLQTAPIFGSEDFDDDGDELIDNRKGTEDAFVS